jgi:Clr5 domain
VLVKYFEFQLVTSRLRQPTQTSMSRLVRQHTDSEWESIRGVFTRLYQKEGKRLEEVRSILAEKHHFHAK